MSSRKKHTPKKPQEQEYYSRTLRSLESEPTSDEGFEFPHSDDLEEEEIPPPRKKRPRSKIETAQRHFKSNRNNWIIPLVVTASVAFVILILSNIIDVKQQLGRFEGMFQGITDTLRRHDNDITNIEKELRDFPKSTEATSK